MVPIPFGVWNFIAPWIVDTTIPIYCMAVLPCSMLYGESHLTMTKLSVFVTMRRPSPIVISKGTSPRGQEYSPEKPTSGVFESTRKDLIDVFFHVSFPRVTTSSAYHENMGLVPDTDLCRVRDLCGNGSIWSCLKTTYFQGSKGYAHPLGGIEEWFRLERILKTLQPFTLSASPGWMLSEVVGDTSLARSGLGSISNSSSQPSLKYSNSLQRSSLRIYLWNSFKQTVVVTNGLSMELKFWVYEVVSENPVVPWMASLIVQIWARSGFDEIKEFLRCLRDCQVLDNLCRKAHLLEDKQIPSVGVFDEVFLALGWHLEEIHVTWAHLEKKRTRLQTCTKIHQEVLFSERGDGVASIKQCRRNLSSNGVWILAMTSQRSRFKVDLEPYT
ncbi:hypothetical protein Tco_1066825 [Tanacetum coccineum]|uniref:Uncharacterized protein n=1 Tax=Tanacetum coccineum TaxID=301880 RepID=A0ABQ5HBI1_9ASTR